MNTTKDSPLLNNKQSHTSKLIIKNCRIPLKCSMKQKLVH